MGVILFITHNLGVVAAEIADENFGHVLPVRRRGSRATVRRAMLSRTRGMPYTRGLLGSIHSGASAMRSQTRSRRLPDDPRHCSKSQRDAGRLVPVHPRCAHARLRDSHALSAPPSRIWSRWRQDQHVVRCARWARDSRGRCHDGRCSRSPSAAREAPGSDQGKCYLARPRRTAVAARLNGVSFDGQARGEVLGLVGESGSGQEHPRQHSILRMLEVNRRRAGSVFDGVRT